MSTLTAAQKTSITNTIRDHHLAFMAEVLGKSSIPPAEYARLVKAGKIRPAKALKALPVDAATAATTFGIITGALPPGDAEKMTSGSFWEILKEAPPPLTALEREAAAIARDRIGQYITGLGNKLDAATGHIIVDADAKARRRKLTAVREAVATGIETRTSAKQIATAIQKATGDVKRNWLVVAQTEVHNAMEEGKAVHLVKTTDEGGDALVFKRPRPDACPFCILLYLQPDKKTPRVFKISELMANGDNVGRRAGRPTLAGPHATEWQAVLGAMHPWCSCTLYHMPAGMAFSPTGAMIYVGTAKKSFEVESLNKVYLNHVCESHK